MDTNTFKRYFTNKYSRKDFFGIHEAFHQKGENLLLEKQMNKHWMEFPEDEFPDVQLDSILDKLQHRIYIEEKSKRKAFSFWQVVQRVAAILFLPLVIGSVAYNIWLPASSGNEKDWAEIQCPLGVRTRFHLPDGSTGFLNSGSVLKYPVSFENNRVVNLAGEGYFEVKHNKKSPFHVKTKNLDITDMGTSFDVIAYDNENAEEVVLQSGLVVVSDKKGEKIASLVPDQKLVMDKIENKFDIKNVVVEQYTSWKEGKLMFRNEGIKEVAARLSRWYNADVIVDKNCTGYKNFTFHGTFVDEQLDDVLKILSLGSPISYTEDQRKADKDHTYHKRKIILSINPQKVKKYE